MLKKLAISILLILPIMSQVKASHILGGEITWECIKSGTNSGKYIFKMRIYRDCSGASAPSAASLSVHNHPSVANIPMNFYSITDISPDCHDTSQEIDCSSNVQAGAIEESYFESSPITLSGIPPKDTGWVFTWSTCCRPSNQNGGSNQSYTLRSIMHNYNNQNANPCFDSSPELASQPSAIFCGNHDLMQVQSTYDDEMDSVSYDWAIPVTIANRWDTIPYDVQEVTWSGTYSKTNPLPGNEVLDNLLGTISYSPNISSTQQGNYVYCTKATAYKCGQKVSEVYRDMPTFLVDCSNTTSCVGDSVPNNPPEIYMDGVGGLENTVVYDTVNAGDTISFSYTATDFEENFYGGTCSSVYQYITLQPDPFYFGTGFNNPNSGCPDPPCAILSGTFTNGKQTQQFQLSTNFQWVAHCMGKNPWNCDNSNTVYSFVFRAYDDNCSVPAYSNFVYNVTVNCNFIVTDNSPVVKERNGLKVFPNPSSGTYKVFTGGMKNARIRVSNMQGKVVLKRSKEIQEGAYFPLDLSDYPNGIYFLQVYNQEKGVLSKKLVKTSN